MVRGTGGGPEKTILLGARLADPARTRVTVCYLRDARDDVFSHRRASEGAGGGLRRDPRTPFAGHEKPRRPDTPHRRPRASTSCTRTITRPTCSRGSLARRTGVRTLATSHGWTGHSVKERSFTIPPTSACSPAFRSCWPSPSEIRHELVAHGARPDRVRTLLNGIDPAAFRRRREDEPAAKARFGLPVGRLRAGRGRTPRAAEALRPAYRRVRRHRAGVTAGSACSSRAREAHATRWRRRSPRLGLGGRACSLGQRADIVGVHHALDLFVQSSGYEGTPNVVLEAMALETPIVATDVGGTSELCDDGVDGLIVPSGDMPALAKAIEHADRRMPTGAAPLCPQPAGASSTTCRSSGRVKALDDIYRTLMEPHVKALLKQRGLRRDRRHGPAADLVSSSDRLFSAAIARSKARHRRSRLVPGIVRPVPAARLPVAHARRCHWTATIEFGTLFSQAGARLDENVYVGPRCHLGPGPPRARCPDRRRRAHPQRRRYTRHRTIVQADSRAAAADVAWSASAPALDRQRRRRHGRRRARQRGRRRLGRHATGASAGHRRRRAGPRGPGTQGRQTGRRVRAAFLTHRRAVRAESRRSHSRVSDACYLRRGLRRHVWSRSPTTTEEVAHVEALPASWTRSTSCA